MSLTWDEADVWIDTRVLCSSLNSSDLISIKSSGHLVGLHSHSHPPLLESLGYDVITGSAPNSKDIQDLLGSIKNLPNVSILLLDHRLIVNFHIELHLLV